MLTAKQAKQLTENSKHTNLSVFELNDLIDTLDVIKLKALAGETSHVLTREHLCGTIPEELQKLGYDVNIECEVVNKISEAHGLAFVECNPYKVFSIIISWDGEDTKDDKG